MARRTATRLLPVLAAGGAVAGAVLAVALRDPHVPGSWGTCPVLALTGLPCPGCGGLRAVHDLAHGDVLAALGSNAAVVLGLVAAVVVWGAWLVATVRRRRLGLVDAVTTRSALGAAVALAVFTLLRWVPEVGAVLGP